MALCCKGCCGPKKPLPPPQEQVNNTVHLKKNVTAKETPFGFINIFPGVRTIGHKHTCPMLSVHLYRYSQFSANVAQNRQTINVDRRNRLRKEQGPQTSQEREKVTAEEEVLMIPVEDVTRVTYKSEIKKDGQKDVQSTTTPVYRLSENCCDRCCAGLLRCCCCSNEKKIVPVGGETTTIIVPDDSNRNARVIEEHLPLPKDDDGCCDRFFNRFRCWCCRRDVLTDLIKRTNISTEQQAQRLITISIDYSKYSNLDSASNARLLSREEQEAYYKRRFQPDTKLEFYLINDTEFDPGNFEIKRQQAEALCRTVMHLKGMAGDYPAEDELDSILDQPLRRTFGDLYNEPKLQLTLKPQAQLVFPSFQPRAIE